MSKSTTTQSSTSKSGSRAQKPLDALALLKEDHQRVKKLFEEYSKIQEDGSDEEKLKLVEQITLELVVHTQIEEEIFYPSARLELVEEDLLDEAEVEHGSAKDLIQQLQSMQPGDPKYDATVTVLGEYIEHHVQEEEEELFPQIQKTKLDLQELGEEMAGLQMELLGELTGEEEKSSKKKRSPSKH